MLSGICDMLSGYAIGAMLSGIYYLGKLYFSEHILKRMESKTEGLVSDDYHLMERWMDRFINIFSF